MIVHVHPVFSVLLTYSLKNQQLTFLTHPAVYRTDRQALCTARFCRAGQLATADTCRLYSGGGGGGGNTTLMPAW